MTCGECMTGSHDLERTAGAPPPSLPQPAAVVSYGTLAAQPIPPPLPPQPTVAPVHVVQTPEAPIRSPSPPNPALSDVISIIDSYGSGSIPIFAAFDGTPVAPLSASEDSTRQAPIRPPRPSSSLYPSIPDTTSSAYSMIPGNPDSFAHKYDLIRTLKPSTEGSIHLVASRETGERYIIKQCHDVRDSHDWWRPGPEIDILKYKIQYRHPNIISVVDTIPDDTLPLHPMTNMVTEFCDGGDLGELIEHLYRSNQRTPRHLIFHFISSMINALGFIHHGDIAYDHESDTTTSISFRQDPIVHRDIKPGNIFMKWKPNSSLPDIVLADFGHAELASRIEGVGGTDGFRAPEAENALTDPSIDHRSFVCTSAGDIYAFGMSLYMLITHHMPERFDWDTIDAEFARSTVTDCPDVLEILKACLAFRPADRPRANQLYAMASVYKRAFQGWSEDGGRLNPSIWPNTHNQQTSSSGTSSYASPHYGPASSVYSSPLSSVASGENLHQLRHVHGRVNLTAYRSNNSSSPFTSQAGSYPAPIIIAPASTGAVVQGSAGVFLDLPIADADQLGSAFSWDSTEAESEDGDSPPSDGADALSDAVFHVTV
ncbi:uncharacterized protein MYCFIDRAFT_78722 [Pseudocercospora fijiensis CIRAD86]|uniref:Protein kinase domain-containing protein n=1 Tax=Pseudocercospora fijiensis (strain CIRAD86) TaxID=383855 RepID=M2YVW9_PSEFD|nr:uncharacterized protein MYCFIDRAFT_78722 [Pseudocercospora fijiensis CIRAD86]EME81850.1 hypothetical protein MYCFIDRAFT_78722 [Pseudocercospora fijiensis CIRAD86]